MVPVSKTYPTISESVTVEVTTSATSFVFPKSKVIVSPSARFPLEDSLLKAFEPSTLYVTPETTISVGLSLFGFALSYTPVTLVVYAKAILSSGI